MLAKRIFRKIKRIVSCVCSLDKRTEDLQVVLDKMGRIQREVQYLKARVKQIQGERIAVVFICHNPSLWGKVQPVYRILTGDARFQVTLVAMPYRHESFGDDQFHDGGMMEFLEVEEGVLPVAGRDDATGEWFDLQGAAPDYVFYQTPYDHQFPPDFSSSNVSAYARVCYVPYIGILLYRGEVEIVSHPIAFFKNVDLVFLAHEKEREDFIDRFDGVVLPDKVHVTGAPMLDYIHHGESASAGAWNLPRKREVKRVIWTPRWRTLEGYCHFFDYKEYFIELAQNHEEIDFLLRPHPFSFQNFMSTGELTSADYERLLHSYEVLDNAKIDLSGNYRDTFRTGDILISDMSSIMVEFFVTGNPIIYTHRVADYNEFGRQISQGFYWVNNQAELDETLADLLAGNDPLKAMRQEILEALFPRQGDGASFRIRELLVDGCQRRGQSQVVESAACGGAG